MKENLVYQILYRGRNPKQGDLSVTRVRSSSRSMNSERPETDQYLTYVKWGVTHQWEMKDFSIKDDTIDGKIFGENVRFQLYHTPK